MIGAIIGDIAGSRFKYHNISIKNFDLMTSRCKIADNTIMNLSVCKALVKCNYDYTNLPTVGKDTLITIGQKYPNCGYDGMFFRWIFDKNHEPNRNYECIAATRVSPVAYVAKDEAELKELSRIMTSVSHNHIEAIKGAECMSMCVYYALNGKNKEEIKEMVNKKYYKLNQGLYEISLTNKYNTTCQVVVPQAVVCFLESVDFEDAIRNAVSIGGNSDTICSLTGAIAGAFYGVNEELEKKALTYLDEELLSIYNEFKKLINKE